MIRFIAFIVALVLCNVVGMNLFGAALIGVVTASVAGALLSGLAAAANQAGTEKKEPQS